VFSAAPETSCRGSSSTWLQGQVECAQVKVCSSANPTMCAQVALRTEVSNDRVFPDEVLVSLDAGVTNFAVAVRPLPGVTEYDISLVAYGDRVGSTNEIIASGRATRVQLNASGPINILLSPTNDPRDLRPSSPGPSCPGGEGAASVRRAFHQAVALPSGDVLLIGGIEVPAAGIPVGGGTAGLLTGSNLVQVFTPGADAVQAVTIAGAAEQFSRALFEARWIGRDGDEERIRLFGGVTGSGRVAFSTNLSTVAPVTAMAGAMTAPVVDALYNPTTRTLRVAGEALSVFETTAVETVLSVSPYTPQPSQGVYGTAATGGRFAVVSSPSSTIDVPLRARRGATLSPFGMGWLVYGGNTTDPVGMREAERFALLSPMGMMTTATYPAGITNSAFHTATALDFDPTARGDEMLVFVGGLPVSDANVAPFSPAAEATASPVRGVRLVAGNVESLGGTVTDSAIERAFHTATLVALEGGRGRIIVVGGTTTQNTGLAQRLVATDNAFEINVDRTTASMTRTDLHPLRIRRFGHTATYLPSTQRLLITGGLTGGPPGSMGEEDNSVLMSAEEPEMIYLGTMEGRLCGAVSSDAGSASDARMSSTDAGPTPDSGDAGMSSMPDAFGPDAR
jgi:hypothetical protein